MKSCLKGFVAGVVFALTGLATVSATMTIKSAEYNSNRIILDGRELELAQPMISVVNQGEDNAYNYMPVRGLLEALGYSVQWDSDIKAVVATSKEAVEMMEDSYLYVPTVDSVTVREESTSQTQPENYQKESQPAITEEVTAVTPQNSQSSMDSEEPDWGQGINPTDALLNGQWVTEASGTAQAKYRFSPGGSIERIVDIYGEKMYSAGSFKISGDEVEIQYTYQDDGTTKKNLVGNEIIKEKYKVQIAAGGRRMKQSLQLGTDVMEQIYEKYSGNDFFGYGNPVSLPGQTVALDSAAMLNGKWAARVKGKLVKYSFDDRGNVAELSDATGSKIYRKGTYELSGNRLHVTYTYIFNGTTNGVQQEGGTAVEDITFRFSPDGKILYRKEPVGELYIHFTRDTGGEFYNYQ